MNIISKSLFACAAFAVISCDAYRLAISNSTPGKIRVYAYLVLGPIMHVDIEAGQRGTIETIGWATYKVSAIGDQGSPVAGITFERKVPGIGLGNLKIDVTYNGPDPKRPETAYTARSFNVEILEL